MKNLLKQELGDAALAAEGTDALMKRLDAQARYPDREAIGLPTDFAEGEGLEKMIVVTIARLDCLIQICMEARA